MIDWALRGYVSCLPRLAIDTFLYLACQTVRSLSSRLCLSSPAAAASLSAADEVATSKEAGRGQVSHGSRGCSSGCVGRCSLHMRPCQPNNSTHGLMPGRYRSHTGTGSKGSYPPYETLLVASLGASCRVHAPQTPRPSSRTFSTQGAQAFAHIVTKHSRLLSRTHAVPVRATIEHKAPCMHQRGLVPCAVKRWMQHCTPCAPGASCVHRRNL